jgi:small-conductance mechanosensitive channel
VDIIRLIESLPSGFRILAILVIAVVAHLVVRELKVLTQWILVPKTQKALSPKESFAWRYPKIAGLTTILVGAFTFFVYFIAIGLILKEFNVSLTKYLASASVIGLAIGFGSQGLVQDVVIGLTLIFSDALNLEDIIEISGQVGKVEKIGLRFTTLINLHGQRIYIPNRNIGIIGRFRKGYIRAYVDIQLPPDLVEDTFIEEIESIADGMYHQHRGIILARPGILGVQEALSAQWRYLRLKFHLWPGQGSLIETTFKQRVVAVIKKRYPDYSDWMVIVTYRAE